MQEVKVKRAELLTRIRANMESHRDLFLKAQEGYRARVIEELDRMLQEAKGGKPIRRAVSLAEPQDHTTDYARVVDMLEMSQDDVIEIDAVSFAQYVRDEWAWKRHADHVNTTYSTGGIVSA